MQNKHECDIITPMEQPQLFHETPSSAMSIDERAAQIAENARLVEYPDRTSEAALDQGWGPTEKPPISTTERPRYEVPGLSRGRVNKYDQPVTTTETQRGMTAGELERQAAINAAGAAAARATLQAKTS